MLVIGYFSSIYEIISVYAYNMTKLVMYILYTSARHSFWNISKRFNLAKVNCKSTDLNIDSKFVFHHNIVNIKVVRV